MILAFLAEKIRDAWRLGDDLPAGLNFAVEDPQGIGAETAAAIIAEIRLFSRQKTLDGGAIGGTAGRAAERVHLEMR